MDPNPNPNLTNAQAEPEPKASGKRLAAFFLRSADPPPPNFAVGDMEADNDEGEEEGFLTAATWKDEMEGLDEDKDTDASPPSPSSGGYATERGSSLASSGDTDEPKPEGLAAGAED